ncbi:MAG: sigma-70 family RNA polymerase sigma factor [Cytophagales bacterium]|nr:sigma-70 family RNA polymerase sigma factor [Cytophagales bacterium]
MTNPDLHKNLKIEVYAPEKSSDERPDAFASKGDLEIWRNFKRGNESAFTFIYRQYFKKLFTFSSQFIQDKELIKDCIQDLFIELRKNRKNLSDTTSIKLYLFKSIKRKVIVCQKRLQTNSLNIQKYFGHDFKVTLSAEHLMINRQLEEQKLRQLNMALKKLTKRQGEVIYYYFYENMDYGQVMEMMDLKNIKSARNLVYKALKVLKSEVDPQ